MLDKTDSTVIKEWLAAAFESGRERGLSPADLARHCEVTPQAVHGWITTGRISKTNLTHAVGYFGHAPAFRPLTREPEPDYHVVTWPFPNLDQTKIRRLSRDDLLRLEGALLLAAAQIGLDIAKLAAA